jgi:hypothetical protein
MKLSSTVLSLFISTLVASEGISILGQSILGGKPKALGDGAAVPGDNPLTFCKANHDDDLLVLEKVDLTPNPPLKYVSFPMECRGHWLMSQ